MDAIYCWRDLGNMIEVWTMMVEGMHIHFGLRTNWSWPNKTEIKKHNLFLSSCQIERTILKCKSVYALLVVERNKEKGMSVPKLLVQPLLKEFDDVFPINLPHDLALIRGIEYHIDLIPRAFLPNRAAYRCNPMKTKKLQRQVDEPIIRGFVRENMSPCLVSTLLIPKKDRTYMMCMDSGAINNITIKLGILFPSWMICLMSFIVLLSFPRLTWWVVTTNFEWEKVMNVWVNGDAIQPFQCSKHLCKIDE